MENQEFTDGDWKVETRTTNLYPFIVCEIPNGAKIKIADVVTPQAISVKQSMANATLMAGAKQLLEACEFVSNGIDGEVISDEALEMLGEAIRNATEINQKL